MLIFRNKSRISRRRKNNLKQLLTRNNIFIFVSQFQDKFLNYNSNKFGESCKNDDTYYIQSIQNKNC